MGEKQKLFNRLNERIETQNDNNKKIHIFFDWLSEKKEHFTYLPVIFSEWIDWFRQETEKLGIERPPYS